MRVAFVEPYFGGSHRAFAEGLAAASRHDVVLVTHPASFWKWRMQGGFLTLARLLEEEVDSSGPFDVIVASGMVDAAGLVGAARRVVGASPLVVYMHENQLTYPTSPRDEFDATYAMTNWSSTAVADLVLFNSRFHLDEWYRALPGFLRAFPDVRHGHRIEEVRAVSEVLPVGVDLGRLDRERRRRRERPLVLWNHRWEHDRGPDLFAAAVLDAVESGGDFDIALAGERFVADPTGFEELSAALGERVIRYGFAGEADYVKLLRAADVVVSTSRQEFFGISVTEAVYAGAFPLLPDRLVYPERLPVSVHGQCLYAHQAGLVAGLLWATSNRPEAARIADDLKPHMAVYDWSVVGPAFDRRLEALVRDGRSGRA